MVTAKFWSLGSCIKGTFLYVSGDNIVTHSLAGYQETLNVQKFSRFCSATFEYIQQRDVKSGTFTLRTQNYSMKLLMYLPKLLLHMLIV